MGAKNKFLLDTPTSAEQGFPDLVYDSYLSFLAPAKTPQAITKKLEDLLEKAAQEKALRDKIEDLGFVVEFLNSQNTQKYLEGELRWGDVIKKANIIAK